MVCSLQPFKNTETPTGNIFKLGGFEVRFGDAINFSIDLFSITTVMSGIQQSAVIPRLNSETVIHFVLETRGGSAVMRLIYGSSSSAYSYTIPSGNIRTSSVIFRNEFPLSNLKVIQPGGAILSLAYVDLLQTYVDNPTGGFFDYTLYHKISLSNSVILPDSDVVIKNLMLSSFNYNL